MINSTSPKGAKPATPIWNDYLEYRRTALFRWAQKLALEMGNDDALWLIYAAGYGDGAARADVQAARSGQLDLFASLT